MTFKGYSVQNRFRLHKRMVELQLAGKTEAEIAVKLGLTSSTVQYLATLFQTGDDSEKRLGEQRSQMACELWAAGKNLTEISRILNISRQKAHQLIHKQEWLLRHPEQRKTVEC